MMNAIFLTGRMTRDIEIRRTGSGKAVGSFSIACDRDFGEETDFFDIVAWEKTAEFIERNLGKGRLITVIGRLQIREWTDKNGNKRRNAEVIANQVYFADSKPKDPVDEFAPLDDDDMLPFA